MARPRAAASCNIPIWVYDAPMPRAATTTDAFNAVAEPQVSKHLRVLREVGAVEVRDEGRQRLYRLNGHALKPIHDWVSTYEPTWTERFERLDVVLEDLNDQDQGDGGDAERPDGQGDVPNR